jgi:hypothetical protein
MDRISKKQVLDYIKGSKQNKIFFWPGSKIVFIPRSLRTTRNNHSSPHNGPIKNFFPQNLIIYAQLTMKKNKIQNRSQKNSRSCVPLRALRPDRGGEVTSSNSAYHSTAVQQRPLRWLLSIQPSAYEQESRHERRGAKQQCLKWGVGTRATNCQQETKLGGIGDYSSYKTTNLFVFVVGRSVFHFRCPPVAGWKENYLLSVRVGSSAGSVAKGRP